MRILVALLCAFGLPLSAFATTLQCEVTDGAYKAPGDTSLVDAGRRDPNIIGSIFLVKREPGEIVGSELFSNVSDKVTVLRNVNEIINILEVMSVSQHSDLKFLAIKEFEGKLTFSYYFGNLNLLLTGDCADT